jgi:hypothetical protein
MILGEFVGNALNGKGHLPRTSKGSGAPRQTRTLMIEFARDQKWMMADAIFGTFFAEAVEVSDDGASGTVIVTDEKGNLVDTFAGTAPEFQASGEWRLIE